MAVFIHNYDTIQTIRDKLKHQRTINLTTHIYLKLCLYLNMVRAKYFILRQTFILIIAIMQTCP